MNARAVNTPPNPSTFETYVTCKDHLVSGEEFKLLLDDNLDLLMTSPKPDDANLGKYYESEAYISHTDSKKSVLDFVYQTVKGIALKQKLKLINSFNSEGLKILDIGAGTGDFLKTCSDNGWEVSGVEPSSKARSIAQKKVEKNKGSFFENIKELKKEEGVFLGFDVITMWHVLEHVPNLDETIFDLKKLLKPEGTIVIAVPNFKSYDASYYKQFWAAYDVPRHLWHFSQTAIRRLFFFQSMEVVKTLPMKFDAFYVALLSEKHKNNKQNFFKAFYVGLKSNLKAKRTKEYSSLIYVIKNTKKWF
jgi:2-polyprenyl-3-methyl-5-hydroxy-6-metoxy-1,4-benzoquinol methylase